MPNRPNRKFKKCIDDYIPTASEDILNTKVEDMGLSDDTLTKLKSVELYTVCDVARCQMRHLYRIPNMGKKNVFETLKRLQSFGLDFRQPPPKPQGEVEETKKVTNPNRDVKNETGKREQDKKDIERKKVVDKRKDRPYNEKSDIKKTDKPRLREPQRPVEREKVNSRERFNTRTESIVDKSDKKGIKKKELPKMIDLPPLKNPDGLYKYYHKGKWGYKDESGKVIIQPAYDEAFNFSEGLACVEVGEKCGYINKVGEMVIPLIYDTACSFSEGLASVTLNDKCGYIDSEGNIEFEFEYEAATPFVDGVSLVKKDGKWGYMNRETREIRLR